MTDIQFTEEYSGKIDGSKVATMYRAINSPGQPFCVIVPGYPGELSIDLNSAYLEEDDPDWDFVANDREQGRKWVVALTELIAKARAYDSIIDQLDAAEIQPREDIYVVDQLGDEEVDQEWVDEDGDRYKHIDGAWHWRNGPDDEFRLLLDYDSGFLTDFGPYNAVRKVSL